MDIFMELLPVIRLVVIGVIVVIIALIVKDRREEKALKEKMKRHNEQKEEASKRLGNTAQNVVLRSDEQNASSSEEERARQRALVREEASQRRREKFADYLASLPRVEPTSQSTASSLLVGEMGELTFTNLTKRSPVERYGDFIVVDVETTGLNAGNCKIIEVAAIKFMGFVPVQVFETFVNPKVAIPAGATKVNHITDDMVADAPTIEYVIPALIEFSRGFNLIAHNFPFDAKFLFKSGFDFREWNPKLFDTLSLARTKEKDGPANYKLDTLCEWFAIFRPVSHRSASDCLATGLLFNALFEQTTGANVPTGVEHFIDRAG